MKVVIQRYDGVKKYEQQYEFETEKYHNRLLDALHFIKTKKDGSLTFKSGCRSGVCGSCAVLVNGIEKLACKCQIHDGDIVAPIKNGEIIRDLVTNIDYSVLKIKKSNAYLATKSGNIITKKDEKRIDKQSECILCQGCYSACPVIETKPDFLGPFVLTRIYKYVEDKKEANTHGKIATIQTEGVWDCTLCGACTLACPQGIDPKNDIVMLRNLSVMSGFNDPNTQNFNRFNMDFGFNPNDF